MLNIMVSDIWLHFHKARGYNVLQILAHRCVLFRIILYILPKDKPKCHTTTYP